MENALRDWRLPVIFAVPILLWAGLLYLVFQPLSGAGRAATAADNFTLTQITTPRPAFIPPPYPTYAWPSPKPTVPCAHQTVDPKAITEHGPNGTFIYVPALVCAP